MGKVSYHFITCLFNAVLIYIIAINYTGWSGAYIDLIGTQTNTNWSNSYFGFQSIQMMLSEMDDLFKQYHMDFDNFVVAVTELLQCFTFHVPKLLSDMANNTVDIFSLLRVVFDLLVQPIEILFYILQVLAYLVTYACVILTIVFRAFGGYYNVPFDNIPDYHPTSLVIPPVLASGFML